MALQFRAPVDSQATITVKQNGKTVTGSVARWGRATQSGQIVQINYEPNATATATVSSGTVSLTVTSPARYEGTYSVNTADLAGGPAKLIGPGVVVTGGVTAGGVLAITTGLYVNDPSNGTISVTRGVYRDDALIPGTNGVTSYTITPADQGHTLTVREVVSDSAGSRTFASDEFVITVPGTAADTFTAPDLTRLKDYVGESGVAWDSSVNYCNIEGGFLRNADYAATTLQARLGNLSADHFAEANMVLGAEDNGVGLAVRVIGNTGYWVKFNGTGWWIFKMISGKNTKIASQIRENVDLPNPNVKARLEVQGTNLRFFVNDVEAWSGTDSAITNGQAGVYSMGSITARSGTKIDTFHAGDL